MTAPVVDSAPAARGAWIALVAAVLLVSAVRLHRLDLPLERDEGEYAYGGQLIRAGEFSYDRLRTMKLPGAHAGAALVFSLLGESKEALRGGLLALNAANMVLVFLLARRMFGAAAGVAAAASFGVLALNHWVLGLYAHAEHFSLLPVLAAALLLQRAGERRSRGALAGAGMCLGLAVVMKQQAAAFLAFGVLVAAGPGVWGRPRDPRRALVGTVRLLGGALLPLALVLAVFFLSGGFESFWFWTFTLARQYTSAIGLAEGLAIFIQQGANVFGGAMLLWILAACGVATLLVAGRTREHAAFLSSFALCSFLATCPGFYFREHYFVFVLPAAALFVAAAVAWALEASARGIGGLQPATRRPARAGIGLVVLAALASPLVAQRGYLLTLDPAAVSRLVYTWNPFAEIVHLGQYLRERSSPEDRIAVLGSEPELLFYARRRSATGFVYMYPLMERHPFALAMQRQMIAEVEAAAPRWFVSCGVYSSWLMTPDSHDEIIEWGARYTSEHYRLVGIADVVSETETVYRFGAEAEAYAPASERFVLVFERKD